MHGIIQNNNYLYEQLLLHYPTRKEEFEKKKAEGYFMYNLGEVNAEEKGAYSVHENIVVFNQAEAGTLAHELMHSLGLDHTFTIPKDENKRKEVYNYRGAYTDNVMDYSHANRLSTWHWQWKLMQDRKGKTPKEER